MKSYIPWTKARSSVKSRTLPDRLNARSPLWPAAMRRVLAALCLCSLLAACRIAVEVPEGGSVESLSGAYSCQAGQVCNIRVNDVFFDETFVAVPAEGYFFKKWTRKPNAFCGDKLTDCALATTGFVGHQGLLDILESNKTFYLSPQFEKIPQIMEEDISTEGKRSERKDGFTIAGKLVIRHPSNVDQVFEDADLDVRFNDDGELYSMTGTAVVPNLLFENITLENKLRAEVGYRTGAEINADKAIEINLRDERRYMVMLLDQELDIKIADPDKPGQAKKEKITTPLSGKIIFILDTNDPMFYRYGETPLYGAYGDARSKGGLLPFVPALEVPGIDRFDGHRYYTGKYGVGIKLVDLLQLEGEMVVLEPDFTEIDFSRPFEPLKEYRAGFNGAAKLVFSVVGFGFFEMEVAKASAMINAGPRPKSGNTPQRGAMKMVTVVEPQKSPLPEWMPIRPSRSMNVVLEAGSSGKPVLTMTGGFESTLPRAEVEGLIRITPDAVTLSGSVIDPRLTVPITMTFRDNETRARVGINVDLTDQIASNISEEFDNVVREIEDAKARLEEAIADYEFELSLRGLRQALPGITDAVRSELKKIPGVVYDKVRSKAITEIDKYRCPVICIISKTTRNNIASSIARKAEDRAESEIQPYLNLMTKLKTLAQSPNDEELLDALESALRLAYSYRTFKRTISYEIGIPKVLTKTFSYKIDERILDSATAARILQAADNIQFIPATSDIVIKGQQILDQLPDEEIVSRIRREVENGVAQVPGVSEVTYVVRGGNYQAAVKFTDGSVYQVDFNVLNPSEAAQGIADLVANELLAKSRP